MPYLKLSCWRFLCALALLSSVASAQAPRILRVDVTDRQFDGLPIQWGSQEAILLERSGGFRFVETATIRGHELLDSPFVPQSLTEARVDLQNRLGKSFEVTIAGPYVIATPHGQGRRWQSRFQSLLSGYLRYFQVRGWKLKQVEFPLVVIVFPTRSEFLAYAQTQQPTGLPPQAVGSYFPMSNQCILYQLGSQDGTNWSETEATIVHEAVHQLAFNTGIHERLFRNPLWFVEGFATMFETPAVYDLGLNRSAVDDRVDLKQLRTLKPLLADANHFEHALQTTIESDDIFRSNPELGYALAWAMTFYLAERMPGEYQALLHQISRRGFGSYNASQRSQDFAQATKTSTGLLAVQMARFFNSLGPATP